MDAYAFVADIRITLLHSFVYIHRFWTELIEVGEVFIWTYDLVFNLELDSPSKLLNNFLCQLNRASKPGFLQTIS